MATIRKISGRFYAYFHDPARTPARKSVPLRVSQKTAALKLLHRLEERYAEGRFDPWTDAAAADVAKPASFADAVERFLAARSALRPATRETYRRRVLPLAARLPAGVTLAMITAGDIRRYVEDARTSEASRASRYRHVASFFSWAEAAGFIERNPVKEVKRPAEGRREAAFLMPSDVTRLVTCIEADAAVKVQRGQAEAGDILWLRDVILFAVNTGFRLGEICALRFSGLNVEGEFVAVENRAVTATDRGFRSKSGHERRIPLVGDALVVARRLRAARPEANETAPVFAGVRGGALYPNYVSRRFKEYARLAGLGERIHFHSLRHTCASWLVMRGVPLPIIQKIMGHSTITLTQRYAHLDASVIRDAMKGALGGSKRGPVARPHSQSSRSTLVRRRRLAQ